MSKCGVFGDLMIKPRKIPVDKSIKSHQLFDGLSGHHLLIFPLLTDLETKFSKDIQEHSRNFSEEIRSKPCVDGLSLWPIRYNKSANFLEFIYHPSQALKEKPNVSHNSDNSDTWLSDTVTTASDDCKMHNNTRAPAHRISCYRSFRNRKFWHEPNSAFSVCRGKTSLPPKTPDFSFRKK